MVNCFRSHLCFETMNKKNKKDHLFMIGKIVGHQSFKVGFTVVNKFQ